MFKYLFHAMLFWLAICSSIVLSACGGSSPAPAKTEVIAVSFSPPSPATMQVDERVSIDITFTSGSAEGVRIWAIPEIVGNPGTGSYCASSVIAAKQGIAERCIVVESDTSATLPAVVNKVRLVIKNPDQSTTFYDELVDVNYTWTQ